MQHFTRTQIAENLRIEEFNELMYVQLSTAPINAQSAKIAWNALRMSLRSNKDAFKMHYLNIRHAFAHHHDYKKVPIEIEEFLKFLEKNQNLIDWNSIIQQLEILWR
jgi:hypothetical protein